MSMIKWKIVPNFRDEIEPVEVIDETACFVTIATKDRNGMLHTRRMHKDGSEKVFDTFDAAKKALIENSEQRVRTAEATWQREKARLKTRNDIPRPSGEVGQ